MACIDEIPSSTLPSTITTENAHAKITTPGMTTSKPEHDEHTVASTGTTNEPPKKSRKEKIESRLEKLNESLARLGDLFSEFLGLS